MPHHAVKFPLKVKVQEEKISPVIKIYILWNIFHFSYSWFKKYSSTFSIYMGALLMFYLWEDFGGVKSWILFTFNDVCAVCAENFMKILFRLKCVSRVHSHTLRSTSAVYQFRFSSTRCCIYQALVYVPDI